MGKFRLEVPELHHQPYVIEGDSIETHQEALEAFIEDSGADIRYDKDERYFVRSYEWDEVPFEIEDVETGETHRTDQDSFSPPVDSEEKGEGAHKLHEESPVQDYPLGDLWDIFRDKHQDWFEEEDVLVSFLFNLGYEDGPVRGLSMRVIAPTPEEALEKAREALRKQCSSGRGGYEEVPDPEVEYVATYFEPEKLTARHFEPTEAELHEAA